MPSMNILLVEDNPADAELTEISLEQADQHRDRRCHLHVVPDGFQAMEFLRKEDRYADAPRPDLILLDLNLPKKNGREVLAEIKADNDLKSIPVTVLTSSLADEDVRAAYQLHANCYVRKPTSLGEFQDLVEGLERFWFSLVKLPPHD